MNWSEMRVAIVGTGRSGIAAAAALLQRGATLELYDRDMQLDALEQLIAHLEDAPADPDMEITIAEFPQQDVPDWESPPDLIIVSPALPPSHPLFEGARAHGVPIWSEIELGYRLAKAPIIAITGTNAKTTTAALIHHLLTHAGIRAHLCGNIAGTESDQTLTTAALKAQPDEWLVAEVSSFQLQNIHQFRPRIAVITTITPDHLDYHGSFEAYARAKGRLLENLTPDDWAVLNGNDAGIQQLLKWLRAENCPGLLNVERAGHLILNPASLWGDEDLKALSPACGGEGMGMGEGALLAATVARIVGCSEAQIQTALASFRGVPHRMEFVAEIKGVRFINNSMCTNAAALDYSLRLAPKPCIVIAGGVDKNDSAEQLADAIRRYCRAAMLIGRDGERIGACLSAAGYTNWRYAGTLERAVEQAFALAQSGETVILAPGCASFDQFRNFIERGERFRACVRTLSERGQG